MLLGILAYQVVLDRRIRELKSPMDAETLAPDASMEEESLFDVNESQDAEFDSRISRIKDELAKQDTTIRTGHSADELHPSVHNLPHNSITQESSGIPDEEYAD